MKSWQEDVETLFQEVDKFPLELRIAFKLHSEGITSERMLEIWKSNKSMQSYVSEPTFIKIRNYMRDLDQGFFKKVTFLKRLKQLSKKL